MILSYYYGGGMDITPCHGKALHGLFAGRPGTRGDTGGFP
jgi:hypothetical protein